MKQENHVTEPCASIQDDLKAYCDGELSWLRRIQIRRHLAACVPCREEVHAMQSLHEGLRRGDSPEEAVAPALRERILAQVATIPPLPSPRRTPPLWQYGLAASLAANCCLLLFLWYRTGALPTPQPAPSTARPAGGAAPMVSVTPSKSRRPLPSVESARNRNADSAPGQGAFQPPAATAPPQSPVVRSVASPDQASYQAVKTKSLAANVAPDANAPKQADRQVSLSGPPPVTTATGIDSLHDTVRLPAGESRPQPAPALKSKVSVAPAPGDAPEPGAAVPPAAGTADKPVSLPAAPPAPALVAPVVAPPPAAFARGLGGGGFGGSVAAPMKLGIGRDKPVAVNPWPVLSVSSSPDADGRAARTVKADWQVDERGRVSDIHFVAAGSTALEAAVQDAIRRNHYLPALKNGKPVAARMSYEFVVNP